MAAIIAAKHVTTSSAREVLRQNVVRVYDALHTMRGKAPYLRIRGEREWQQYGLQADAHTLHVEGDRYLPVRLKGERAEAVTGLCLARDAPAVVGWRAAKLAALARDPTTALWRVCMGWEQFFVGFVLVRLELSPCVPMALFMRFATCDPVPRERTALHLSHAETGVVRFELP